MLDVICRPNWGIKSTKVSQNNDM